MVEDAGVTQLPPLYARWIDQLLQGPIPDESRAPCDDCAMCGSSGLEGDPGPAIRFEPATKCCTFLPSLPSFLVGAVLRDEDPAMAAGRASVRARISARIGVTPWGLERTPTFALLYRHGVGGFGRITSLRCPHLAGDGRCGIWRHREATCATWFCRHDRGALGMAFWRRGLQPLLESVERALVLHAARVLDLDDVALDWLLLETPAPDDPLDAAALDGRVDEDQYQARWGRRHGGEEAYYEACAEMVEALSWKDVLAIGGAEVAARSDLFRALYRQLLDEKLPRDALELGRVEVEPAGADHVRLYTYSPFDGLLVPRAAFEALPRSGGAEVAALVETLGTIAGAVVGAYDSRGQRRGTGESLLRALADAEVLVPAKSLVRPAHRRKR